MAHDATLSSTDPHKIAASTRQVQPDVTRTSWVTAAAYRCSARQAEFGDGDFHDNAEKSKVMGINSQTGESIEDGLRCEPRPCAGVGPCRPLLRS